MERPRTSESAPVRGSNGCVRCARKSDPMNDRATTLFASQRQMAMPTDEEARRREPLTGSTAIPRVKYGGQNHCASPTTSGAFTIQKQCNRPPTMRRSGQLGCRTSEPARQPTRLKGLTRDPMFGKFSDVARANRQEADLPEVNLPPRCRLRGGAREPMKN